MAQSLLGIAEELSRVLAASVAHRALVIFTEDCTGRPQKKAGAADIIDSVSIDELDVVRANAAGAPFRVLDAAVLGGRAHRSIVWTADTNAILVLVDAGGERAGEPGGEHAVGGDTTASRAGTEPVADDVLHKIAGIWQIIALSIRHQVATASPAYLADSRAQSNDRASLIADLHDAHATTLESMLLVLRSSTHSDAAARQRAIEIASSAMVRLRSVSDRNRTLAEEPVHSAFERLQDDLAPLVRYGDFTVEFVAPPAAGRPLPGEVAHAARAIVRGAVLALVDSATVSRVRVKWDCDGSNLLVAVRDDGPGDLSADAPALEQLAARVAALEGTFDIEATAGWGSEMNIQLPLDAPVAQVGALEADGLTPRENEVLAYLAEGRRNRAIAAELSISENTTKFHVANILRKMGVTSRAELVALVRSD
ncbi:LuxR C-terminal-related transcriptional regulator [Marisediminicola senii]|uniref:LuxR C-terminal-related transcriptional regulator n=1 Tax=Marisediminicola senii TaxID=2711233 RepID=UPI0013EA72F8|nr:LuxR C-terminal-related transcriptional regulator [Marisediminicola senii]